MNTSIKDQVKAYALSFIKRRPDEEKEPSNFALYLVGIASFTLLAILDLITAVVVGGMTNWLYGILTFGVGIGPTVVNEMAFFRPYASKFQKGLAITGIIVGITATLLIGVMAGGVSAANYFGVLDTTPFKTIIEIAMLISLVVISGIHVTVWMIYIFVDQGVKSASNHAQNLAASKQRKREMEMAMGDMKDAIEIGDQIASLVDEGKGDLINETFKNITGKDILAGSVPVSKDRPY